MKQANVKQALPQQTQPAAPPSPEEKKLLAQLHDIHEPAPVGWWPPAPGWWGLAAIVLALLAAVWLWHRRRQQHRARNRYRVEAVRLLQAVDTSQPAAPQRINEILKRVAVTTFGRTNCGNLTGTPWLRFLQSVTTTECPAAAGNALLEHLYRTDRNDTAGSEALRDYAIRWVESHRRTVTGKTETAEASSV